MDKYLGQDIADLKERELFLRDNADTVEDLGYTKEIPPQQLEELKELLVETDIKLADLHAAKKEVTKVYNDQISEQKEIADEATAKLKARTEFVNEPCYKFIDGDEVGYYNSEGRLVFQRPARSDEKQPRLFGRGDFPLTGTNN